MLRNRKRRDIMKINKKQQVIELLDTLIEAITYINKNINSDYKFMSEISLQAINSVISVLKNSEKCDVKLYELSNIVHRNIINIDKNLVTNISNICDETITTLEEMRNLIKYQVNKKTNIVFMPYNASMWNSLESIWKVANNDETCNCYVVPIPYYKLVSTSDGDTNAIFTYEGNMLPKYVPIVDYKNFDLQDLNPNIIYVHNQYDDCNNATRVESKFFSYNLKKYTDMLVYVTYGILGTYPVSFYKSFYSFIGTRDFDKVIVQSPAFELIAEYSGVDKSKLLSLGSPKFDALVNSLENQQVSEYYINKFKDKTVLLWTTNLMKVINGRDNVLDEIEEVFKLIENNSKYGLIYRPHPLELIYIKSKAPECFERYNNLLNYAKIIPNIVIDTTPSYYEAFKISDALISDRSSVLIEYMATGKPVLIYDIGLKREYYNDNVFDIFANYIVGEDDMTIHKFIELVINKKDNNKQKRLDALKSVIVNADGSCGEKIHNNIKKYTIENSF